MDPEELYEELERISTHLGIEIRLEPLEEDGGSWGGRCTVEGKRLVIVDVHLGLPDRNRLILQALRGFNLDGIYIKPYVRELIDAGSRPPRDGPEDRDSTP